VICGEVRPAWGASSEESKRVQCRKERWSKQETKGMFVFGILHLLSDIRGVIVGPELGWVELNRDDWLC
jgi:hypothetical protein